MASSAGRSFRHRLGLAVLVAVTPALLAGTLTEAKPVEGVGEGTSEAAALKAAQRNAVEQAVGVALRSDTHVANFQVLEDKILSYSEGFIQQSNVVEKGKLPDGTWKVRIKALVSPQDASEIARDAAALGVQLAQMDWPKVMVIPDRRDPGESALELLRRLERLENGERLDYDSVVEAAVRSALITRGFEVASAEQLADLAKEDEAIAQEHGSAESITRDICRKANAKYYVKCHWVRDGNTVTVTVDMFEAQTGSSKGTSTAFGLVEGDHGVTRALHAAADDAFSKDGGVLTTFLNFKKREDARGMEYAVVVENLHEGQLRAIRNVLKKLATKVKLVSSSGSFAQFTVYADGGDDFAGDLEDALQDNKIRLKQSPVLRQNRVTLLLAN